jgi:hypothetical protein
LREHNDDGAESRSPSAPNNHSVSRKQMRTAS